MIKRFLHIPTLLVISTRCYGCTEQKNFKYHRVDPPQPSRVLQSAPNRKDEGSSNSGIGMDIAADNGTSYQDGVNDDNDGDFSSQVTGTSLFLCRERQNER